MSILEKYKSGFDVHGKHDIETVNWLIDSKDSNETELFFMAYDANLYPMPDFSSWNNNEFKQKQIDAALKRTKDFDGEVWLDDVRIK